jgi:uncharacterized membrane protein HdeD (DUF308 family)
MSIQLDPLAIVPSNVIQHSGTFLSMGLGLVCLAVAAWIRSARASIEALYFFGWLFIIASSVEALNAFLTGGWSGFYIHLVSAILYGVTGYLLVAYTRNDSWSTTLIVAMYLIIAGVFNIIAPLTAALPDRGWHAFAGFVTLVLGPALLGYWSSKKIQMSEFRLIGIFIGIDFCVRGLATTFFALTLRNL